MMSKNLKNFQLVSGIILVGILLFGFEWTKAQSGPGSQPGVGSGAISADGLGNVGIGGAATNGIRFRAIASTSDLTTSAMQLLKQNGGIIMNVRGDGYVGIGTSTPAYPLSVWGNIQAANGGSFIGNVAASNVTSGVFGAGNFAFPASLGVGYSSQVGLPATLSVNGNAQVSGATAILNLSDTGGDPEIGFYDGATQKHRIRMTTGNALQFTYQSADLMSISSGGNVGIGGSSATKKLYLNGTSQFANSIQLGTNTLVKEYINLANYSLSNSAAPGAFVIQTNMPMSSQTMFKATIDGYFYDSTGPFKVEVGAYAYSVGTWPNKGHVNVGSNKLAVRLARNISTGMTAIILGSEASTYSYPKVSATYFIAGHSTLNDNYGEGWTITQQTDLSGYDYITAVPDVTSVGTPSGWTDNGATVTLTTAADSVGIGTTVAPVGKLDISSALDTSADNGIRICNTTAGDTNCTHGHYGANKDWYIRSGSASGMVVLQDTGGNVGIGNSSPQNKLHVTGNIGATGWIGAGCESNCSTDAYSLLNANGNGMFYAGATDYTSITGGSTSILGGDITFNNVRRGIIGTYDPAQTQALWAMGASYVLPPTGASSDMGSFYGIGWSYEPNYGGAGNNPQSKAGLGHQALFMQAGTTRTAIGQGIWTAGTITGAGTITSPTGNFTSSVTGAEVYSTNWLRNNTANTGMYNTVNQRHFYSSGSYWVSTGNALLFRNGFEGAASGYVYTDYSNFGLLNNAGSWAVQIPNGGVAVNILGTLTVGGGTGKINVGTVDPIYTIEGKKYATYLPAMTGQKEETTGTAELLQDENGIWTKEIDFKNQEEASDLWLFARVTDLEKQFDKMTILLTPSFNGKVWYERDPANLKLVIHGEYGGEVSYRLSAPRFDAGEWDNRADKEEAEGFNLDKLLGE